MGKNGKLIHCWREYKLVQPLWKSVWRLLKKLKRELPYDPATPPLVCTTMCIIALFTIRKI
jgi:hypothetical protein